MKRIGFFGGSFNPPTNAHINLAKKIVEKCNLNQLIFVPIGDFYKKVDLINFKHRYKMLEIICDNNEKLQVSNLEENSNNALYAIDAFELIKKQYRDCERYYIMGTDNLNKIKEWKNYESLVKSYKYIILERKDNDFSKIINEDKLIAKYKENFTVIRDKKYIDISSSNIRMKLKNNENISNLVPNVVRDYIEKNNLYID